MKTNRLIWALGWATMGSLAALQGCGGDDDDAGTGGKGGTSGSAGKGGTSGSAGKGGTSGSAGKGGTSGSAGKGGTSGTSGTSGAGGAPGGEGGEGGAGSDMLRLAACTAYCQAYNDAQCFDADADTYGDEAGCRDVCVAADWPIGTPGAMSGDTIACRTTHSGLAFASVTKPDETHCGHASENPPAACVD
jgi:hypothetical protein